MKRNIIIVGSQGSGKTLLLGKLLEDIDAAVIFTDVNNFEKDFKDIRGGASYLAIDGVVFIGPIVEFCKKEKISYIATVLGKAVDLPYLENTLIIDCDNIDQRYRFKLDEFILVWINDDWMTPGEYEIEYFNFKDDLEKRVNELKEEENNQITYCAKIEKQLVLKEVEKVTSWRVVEK